MNNQETTLMERAPFLLPDVVSETEFSQDELAEDMDGLQLGFQRVKIPSGGQVQFEIPTEDPDNPDYQKFLEGIIVYSHNANAYWAEGKSDTENTPPDCQSMDGKLGYGCPSGICADCMYNRFGSDPIRPYTDFVNAAFISRRRGVCGSVVRIGLKKKNNGKDDYSVATFQKVYDFSGEELARVRAYADSFKQQVKLLLEQRVANIEAEAGSGVEMERPARVMPSNEGHFEVGAIDGGRDELPL